MWKVTLKGIWAKKVRFLLTGVAVILGVAFVSGTFVLTATISSTFDKLFTEIYQNTDAVVRAKQTFDANFGGGRGRVDASVLPIVRSADGVAEADGSVQGLAVIVDKNDKAVGSNGQRRAHSRVRVDPRPRPEQPHPRRRPRTPHGEPDRHRQAERRRRRVQGRRHRAGDHQGRPGRLRAHRHRKFGSSNSLLGATIVAFTPATAAECSPRPAPTTRST